MRLYFKTLLLALIDKIPCFLIAMESTIFSLFIVVFMLQNFGIEINTTISFLLIFLSIPISIFFHELFVEYFYCHTYEYRVICIILSLLTLFIFTSLFFFSYEMKLFPPMQHFSKENHIPEKFYNNYFEKAEIAFANKDYTSSSLWYHEYINAINYKNDAESPFKRNLAINRKLASDLLLY